MNKNNKNIITLTSIIILIFISIILIVIFYSILDFFYINSIYKNIIVFLLTIFFGIAITKIIAKAIREYIILNGIKQEAETIAKLFSVISYSIIIIIALYLLNINITSLLISAGFLGIILGLAAQSTLGNLFSGIALISSKPFEPGDFITVQTWQYNKIPPTYSHEDYIPGYSGIVKKIGLMYTELITETKLPLYIPNGILNQALIINHYKAKGIALKFGIELNKKIPFEVVKEKIVGILKKNGVDKTSTIDLETLSESNYRIAVFIESSKANKNLFKIKSKILEKIIEMNK
ncbi:MAG: mechanosensitive ion channel family protein [Candidatus Micrarchaeia archaeon]